VAVRASAGGRSSLWIRPGSFEQRTISGPMRQTEASFNPGGAYRCHHRYDRYPALTPRVQLLRIYPFKDNCAGNGLLRRTCYGAPRNELRTPFTPRRKVWDRPALIRGKEENRGPSGTLPEWGLYGRDFAAN